MKSLILAVTMSALAVSAAGQAPCGAGSTWTAGACAGVSNVSLGSLLANSATAPVNIVVAGDSFTICDMTNCSAGPTISTNRWAEQLRLSLQSKYGSHGTGIVPIIDAFPAIINSEAWACTGSWSGNTAFGPSQNSEGTLIVLQAGVTCTFHDTRNISWSSLRVYCAEASNSSDLQVSIDGGSVQHACQGTSGSPTALVATLTSTASTSHSVAFTSPSGFSYLYAAEGVSGTSGVSVHNIAVGGAIAAAVGTTPAAQLAFSDLIPGGVQALLFMDQTNDVASSVASATFSSQIQTMITHEQTAFPAAQVSLAIPPVDVVSTAHSFAAFTAAQKALCKSNLLNCVSMADSFGVYNNTSGLWDLSGAAWPTGNAGVHPNDAGNLLEYQLANAIIQNNYAAVAF